MKLSLFVTLCDKFFQGALKTASEVILPHFVTITAIIKKNSDSIEVLTVSKTAMRRGDHCLLIMP